MKSKKSLGQHFLHDKNIAQKIVRMSGINSNDYVVEIGCGKGILTREILKNCKRLVAYEIDYDLYGYIQHSIKNDKFVAVNADFLEADLNALRSYKSWKIVANIPYNITSPLIFKIIRERNLFSCITLMIQKEVADRISATAGNKTYGRIAVKIQIYYDVKKLFNVPPQVFSPPPKVNSAVIQLSPKQEIEILHPQLLNKLIDKSFQQRRKMLRTSFKSLFTTREYENIKNVDFDLKKRPEKLDHNDFIKLSNLIAEKLNL